MEFCTTGSATSDQTASKGNGRDFLCNLRGRFDYNFTDDLDSQAMFSVLLLVSTVSSDFAELLIVGYRRQEPKMSLNICLSLVVSGRLSTKI